MVKFLSPFIFFCFFLSLFSAFANAEVGLWKVEKGQKTSYLFGTVHVGDKQMQGLPVKVKTAIKNSDKVMVEVNLEALSPLAIQQRSMPFMLLKGNQTLASQLSPEVYNKLKAYFAAKQIDIALFERYAPWAVMVTMLQLEYQKLGFTDKNGIDKQVIAFANESNIAVDEFETLEYQLEMFSQLSVHSNDMLKETFAQMADLNTYFLDLVAAWRSGDLKKLSHYYNVSFSDDKYGQLAEQLMIIERNNNWIEILKEQLPNTSLFVAVGALHLVEQYGLIAQLKAEGYTITPL
ncbi:MULTISPECIES: TraB/GumN family protein [unclassified Pseudoalteromonas]|uniref:TraB/GumN family protein n=1 Tax=unclassified Pseudoalteromonas TaxID=194690 RepID=UPI000F64A5A2|nr:MULTISPECIES: TraB/GumN family protein [unclassified Pseudoalteromonas]RRS09522.1 TraB/GumN family protein [Pseudoalteromonas sp. J010]RXF05131.1 TraB/GumN family protein [Pseudoalteromonas sp. PS5]USD28765.1 TraB/GumN family protein [Pseudoalteromonas sp. SCSIO 43201]